MNEKREVHTIHTEAVAIKKVIDGNLQVVGHVPRNLFDIHKKRR